MTVLLPTLARRNNGRTFFKLTPLMLKPHAAAGSSFPGTLKTSLGNVLLRCSTSCIHAVVCAPRMFPTWPRPPYRPLRGLTLSEGPERNYLRLHAQGCGSTSIFRSHKEQCFGKFSGIKLEATSLSGFETPAGVVGFPVPAASDVGNIRGAHRESRASVGTGNPSAHAEARDESNRGAHREVLSVRWKSMRCRSREGSWRIRTSKAISNAGGKNCSHSPATTQN